MRRLALWGNANVLAQKFQLENAVLSQRLGVPIEMLPFGNQTTTNITQPEGSSLLAKAAQAGVLALGLGSGGLGLAALAGLVGAKAPPGPPAVAPIADEIPLIFDYEFHHAGPDAGGSGPAAPAPQ